MAYTTQALVLETNGEVYLKGNNVLQAGNDIGITMPVPTPDGGGSFEGDYWATPINNEGVVTGIQFTPYNLTDLTTKPKPYSVQACKIRWQGVNTTGKQDYWFVLGTSAQWAAASLPDATSLVYFPVSINPQPVVDSNSIVINGSFKFDIGIPTLGSGQTLYAVGYINGVALTALSAGGYTTPNLLLAAIQSNWGSFGSPSKTITWSIPSTNQTFIQGTFTDNETDEYDVIDSITFDSFVWAITP